MKPRVAFLVGNFPALSATFITNQMSGLIQRGWDVRIFALRNPLESSVHPDVIRYGLAEKTRYFSIPESRLKRFTGAAARASRHFVRHPGKTMKSVTPWFFPGETLRLNTPYYLEPFLNERPDVLLCHFGPNGLVGALLKGLGVPGRLVTVFHGYDLSSFLRGKPAMVYRRLFESGDRFLPVSEKWKSKLLEMGCPEQRTKVLHMGIDLERFISSGEGTDQSTKIELLSVGRLVEKKGHASVIRALKDFHPKRDWRYTIAGDGPLRDKLGHLAVEAGIRSRVHFAGPVDEDAVLSLYRRSHIFLLPSVTGPDGDCEGIPMVLMEAMAMRLPVISTRHSGIPELVEDEKSGFLVKENDAVAIARRLTELAADASLRRRMGAAGREKVCREFNLHIQNTRLNELLLELVAEQRK